MIDRAFSPAQPGPEEVTGHVWMRSVIGWHLAFWAVVALGLLRLAIATDLSRNDRLTGTVLFAMLAASYAVMIQVPVRTGRWWAPGYLSVATALTGVACWLDPSLSLLLFIVYPQVWMISSSLRQGTAFTIALTVSAGTGFLTRYGWSVEALRVIGPQMLVSLLFSVMLGIWISRIIDQSRDRALLLAQIEATRSQLAQAHRAQGVVAERERLAREIHDTLAQGFTSIVMHAQAATAAAARNHDDLLGHLGTIEEVARENLAEARALVAAFTPVGLDGTTLPDAVRRLAHRFGQETGLVVDIEVAESTGRLDRAQEVVLLRAVQEALTNVRRHARASRVLVRLTADQEEARVEVRDDGVGFAPGRAGGGFGLIGMRGRVADVGGDVDVASAPGGGTRVTLRVPVPVPVPVGDVGVGSLGGVGSPGGVGGVEGG